MSVFIPHSAMSIINNIIGDFFQFTCCLVKLLASQFHIVWVSSKLKINAAKWYIYAYDEYLMSTGCQSYPE